MDNKLFITAYRNSLYEGFLSEENAPKTSWETMQAIKSKLDRLEPEFLSNNITSDDLVAEIKSLVDKPEPGMNPTNVPRDLCILAWMAVGAAILAAWVASGGTLIIGSAVAGVTISQPLLAALAGGASAGTIACIAGSCGDC
ncbi:hypothetical protein [Halomonas sp. THAF5a]|uniref:hypothetical protein n=1 Tax=Halomonas sp. THAF5a TaxID=2587844 RepID=UPI0012685F94|nr:hypothetical protein [Halomonas sp. THAF5a]